MADKQITITIVGDASKAQSGFATAGDAAATFDTKISGLTSKFGTFGSVMGGVVAGGAVSSIAGFLKDAAQSAADDQASTEKLKVAVGNTGVSYDKYKDQIDAAIKSGQDLAFSDDDTRSALTMLTQETGDTEEAMKRLHSAQDLARGTGMSLEQAAKLLGKTSDENTGTLKKYGIAVADGATAQDLMNEVDSRFGGQAAAFAESGAGQYAKMQDQLGELTEQVGAIVLPIMLLLVGVVAQVADVLSADVIPAVQNAADAFMKIVEPIGSLVSEYLGPLLAGLTAIGIMIAATFVPALFAWVAAMIPVIAEHIALAAAAVLAYAPIIAAMLAVGLAVALLYEAWSTNFLGIQDITKAVIDFISPYITDAINAIQAIFQTVFPIVQTVVETVFSAIQAAVQTYISAAQSIIETVLPIIQAVFETVFPIIQAVVETVLGTIIGIVQTDMDAIASVINTVLPPIQTIFETVWNAIQAIVDAIAGPAGTLLASVTDGLYAVKDFIGPTLQAMQDIFQTIWDAIHDIVDGIAGPSGTIYDAVSDGLGTVKDAVSRVLGEIQSIWDTIWGAMKSTVTTIIDDITGIWNGVVNTINGAIGIWNGLSMKLDTHIPGVPTISWDSPNLPYLPTIGGGGGGQQALGYQPGSGVPGQNPGLPGPVQTNVNQGPPPSENPLSGTGNLGGAGQLGQGGGGMKAPPPTDPWGRHPGNPYYGTDPGPLYPATSEPGYGPGSTDLGGRPWGDPWYGSDPGAEVDAKNQLFSAGYTAAEAAAIVAQGPTAWKTAITSANITNAPRTPGDPYSQATGYSGGYQAGLAGHDSGHVAYAHVTSSYLNPRTGLHQFTGTPVGGGMLGNLFMDGRIVGQLLGWRHRRDAFGQRDPAGSNC